MVRYRKAANKGLTLHFKSNHPISVKREVVQNELRRADRRYTPQHREQALKDTTVHLRQNGYPKEWIRLTEKHKAKAKKGKTFCLNIPFISDGFHHRVEALLRKQKVPARVANRRGRTLQELAAPPKTNVRPCPGRKACPAPHICQASSEVDNATSTPCSQFYIGMTTRALHERVR